MDKNIKIPVAIQIKMDDLGWHNGRDDRFHLGRPSRSGLPRKHHPDDYIVVNEIGKKLDMKILSPFVVGEWDRKNVLRGVPHVTYDEENWDMASEIDMEVAEKCRDIVNDSEYIDVAYHGLLHGYYNKNKLVTEMQFYPHVFENGEYNKNKRELLPDDEFKRMMDLWFEIYNDWGFKQKIDTFVSPCGASGTFEENEGYFKILNEYGFDVWANGWGVLDDSAEVSNSITFMRGIGASEWNGYDIDPMLLPFLPKESDEHPWPIYGLHWTNFLRFNPEHNMERVDAWAEHMNRYKEVFGYMLSRDIKFAASQVLYNRFSKITCENNKYIIDLSGVDAKGAKVLKNEFYVSVKNESIPAKCIGGSISVYEKHKDFVTYKIVRNGEKTVEILY